MKVSLVQQLPESHKNTLFVAFISDESREDIQRVLKSTQIEENHSKKGKNNAVTHKESIGVLMGLGSSPTTESIRQAAYTAFKLTQDYQLSNLVIINEVPNTMAAVAESLWLSSYQFEVYKSKKAPHSLESVDLVSTRERDQRVIDLAILGAKATCIARDLVNEPLSTLTAEELSRRAVSLGKEHGFKVEVLHKSKIEALKMGGVLAVNAGSIDPPTFNILEYKPANPTNDQPIILVGKGVVYDTGGLSLKPTANSMDFMKCDMAGAAAVIGAICGVASQKLDKHVIGLIPATDNRPGGNAFVPGDVIKMYDGTTVEVLNTDAEGRLILADALTYAKKYNPAMVIDLATLTGSAVAAIGSGGIVMMGTADESSKNQLKKSGETVYERLVEFPLWDEFGDMLKSDIADLKNLGPREAGAITAGKFLEHFTDYPWIHLDIAGPAWLHGASSYRGKNGTGTGVRLLIDFITTYE